MIDEAPGRLRDGAPTGSIALLAAIGGGLALRLAFPGPSLWWLAPFAVGLVLWSIRGRRPFAAAGLGLVAGLAFFIPLIDWIRYFLGTAEANDVGLGLLLALSAFMALWWALFSALTAVASQRLPNSLGWRLGLVPLVVAGLWATREGLSATVPWGGFSWGRVGFSQAGGALDGLFSWVGTAGVSFAVVWLAAFALELIAAGEPLLSGSRAERILVGFGSAARLAPAVTVALLLALVPAWQVSHRGELTIAGVQGNTKSSYAEPPTYSGEVLNAQTTETLTLTGRRLDLVVWPEGGSDLDPEQDSGAAEVWSDLVTQLDAPLLGWAVTHRGEKYYNTSLLWTTAGHGASYDKRHPVPFGEYVPERALFQAIVPGLVDLLQREYTPGTGSPTLRLPDGHLVGVFICFDVADDSLARLAVADGAQVLLAPSNNTDFGRGTDESEQQLQIAKVRALESGRSVLSVSTVATTALIGPDGTIERRVATWRPETLVATVPLAQGTTPDMVAGSAIELFLGGVGLAGLVVALTQGRSNAKQFRRGRSPQAL